MGGNAAGSAPATVLVNAEMLSRRDAALVAREMVARAARDLGPATLDDVLLVVSELVTNAVRHGPGRGPIHLEVRRDGVVRIEVQDQGEGFEAPARKLPDPGIPTGGFGLSIVGRLSADWGITVRAGSTLVWAELPVHDTVDAGAPTRSSHRRQALSPRQP